MSAQGDQHELLGRLLDHVENHHYGKHRGVVTDNQDPDDLGRIRARVPRLLDAVETGWALPAAPYGGTAEQGLFAIPDVGASVWIEFEAGDLAYPIWSGTWWGDGELPEAAKPEQKVLKTAAGHRIVLDDDAGTVVVTDSNENTLTLDSSGTKVEDANGNAITLDSSGITLEDANGNSIAMTSSGITLKGSVVNVGDPASDSLVAFNMLNTALTQFATMLQTHTHVGNLGFPTGPPVPPPVLSIDSARSHHKLEL